jgi:hypothetical protein
MELPLPKGGRPRVDAIASALRATLRGFIQIHRKPFFAQQSGYSSVGPNKQSHQLVAVTAQLRGCAAA